MEMVQKKASLSPWGPADTVSLSKEPSLAACYRGIPLSYTPAPDGAGRPYRLAGFQGTV